MRPVAIDLFSGAGGLSLGLEQAGYDIGCAVDKDPIHAATHQYNFSYCLTLNQSVADTTVVDIHRGIGDREIHLVAGGPPCQGVSTMGRRAIDDPRNQQMAEFVRLVGELKPRYFLFENVPGLTVGMCQQLLHELLESFAKVGYRIQPWQILNAANYGVPQNRKRLFLLGAREDVALPCYPSPITQVGGGLLSPTPTCEMALGDLPNADDFEELLDSDSTLFSPSTSPSVYAQQMRCDSGRGWYFGYRRNYQRSLLTCSARTLHHQKTRDRFRDTPEGEIEEVSRFHKLSSQGIANTLRAGTDTKKGSHTSPRPIHYKYPRCTTVREMARLHGLPDWFRLHPTKWHGARQVGNAVPPPLARQLGFAILKADGISPCVPSQVVGFGKTSFL